MIRLIASDLDETLLDQDSRISDENKEAVAQVLERGLTFTLATGRMFQSALPFAQELGLDSSQPIICYNGALIKRLSGETIHEIPLEPEHSIQIAEYGLRHGWTVNLYYDDELYVQEINQHVKDYADLAQVNAHVVGDLSRFIAEGEKRLSKILIVSEPEDIMGKIEQLESFMGGKVQILRSRKKYIEITNLHAHKGAALLWLADFMGLAAQEVLALGDNNNDLTMLEMAGVGVAVGNALDAVKEVADHVTSVNYEHGVARAIWNYVLN